MASLRGWRITTCPSFEKTVPEKHLRHLRGFAGTGRSGQNQPTAGIQPGDDVALNFVNGQSVSHARQS